MAVRLPSSCVAVGEVVLELALPARRIRGPHGPAPAALPDEAGVSPRRNPAQREQVVNAGVTRQSSLLPDVVAGRENTIVRVMLPVVVAVKLLVITFVVPTVPSEPNWETPLPIPVVQLTGGATEVSPLGLPVAVVAFASVTVLDPVVAVARNWVGTVVQLELGFMYPLAVCRVNEMP